MIKTYWFDARNQQIEHDLDLKQEKWNRSSQDLLWVDLFDFNEREVLEIADVFGFHDLTVEDCLSYSPRAKIDNYDDYDFFVLHALRYEEDKDVEISLEQLNVYLGKNYVVTLHRRTLPNLGRIARQCLDNHFDFMIKGTDFFLYTLIDSLIDKYFPITDRLEDRIEELEDDMYDHPAKEITEEFLDLKKTILTMRRSILSQKKIFASVNGKYSFNIHEDNIPYYLDLLDHIEQIIEATEGFSSLVEGALATYYSVISARTNETMRVLTVISTIFMPLTFVTGFFGMNVPLPGSESIISTLLITLSLLAVSLYMYMIFRWNKWL